MVAAAKCVRSCWLFGWFALICLFQVVRPDRVWMCHPNSIFRGKKMHPMQVRSAGWLIPNRALNCIQSNKDVDLKFEGEYALAGLQLASGQMIWSASATCLPLLLHFFRWGQKTKTGVRKNRVRVTWPWFFCCAGTARRATHQHDMPPFATNKTWFSKGTSTHCE